MITNLIEVELGTARVRRHVDLCDYEDSLELGKEQMDTSSEVDFPGSS